MDKQIKVFVSSTFEDLKEHRNYVIHVLRDAGFYVDPMENWTADSNEPKQFSQNRVKGCDICVLLVAFRRGYIPDGENESITQMEYGYSIALGIDVLVFLLDDDAPWPRRFDDMDRDSGIGKWRNELKAKHGVGFFNHEPNSIKIEPAIARWLKTKVYDGKNPANLPTDSWNPEGLRDSVKTISDQFIFGNDVILIGGARLKERIKDFKNPPPRLASTLFGRGNVFSNICKLLVDNVVLLHGMAGMGKSSLASAVAWSLKDSYPGGVLWLEGQQSRLEDICDEIGMQLKDDQMPRIKPAGKSTRVRVLLGAQPSLVILDNCWDGDVARVFARDCVPAGCGLLITSREKIAQLGVLIEISSMSESASVALFRQTSGFTTGQDQNINKLVNLMAGHPQALSVAGAICLEDEMNVLDLLKSLGSAEARMKRLKLGKDASNNVWATFDLSYQKLNQDEKEAFRFLGGAWAKGASVELLTEAMGSETLSVDNIDTALRGLAKRALVRIEDIADGRRYIMHNLVHDFSLGLFQGNGQTLKELRLKWLKSAVAYANTYSKDGIYAHNKLELELGNLLDGSTWAAENGLWKEVDQLAMSLHERSGFILRRGYASHAVGLLKLGIEATKHLGNKTREGLQKGNLGLALFEISEYKQAISYYQAAYEIAVGQNNSAEESRWLGAIGLGYDSLSDYQKAIEFYEKAIEIDRNNENKKGIGKWLGSAAGAYRMIGNSERAEKYYEEAIRIAREMNDIVNEGVHLSNLGNAYRSWGWGKYDKALDCYDFAIKIAQETGDKATEARATINTARVLSRIGQPEKALRICEKGLELFTQIGFRSGQAYAHGYMGEIYRALGKNIEAITETELALKIHKEVEVYKGQSDWMHNLGVWKTEDGHIEEGKKLLLEALEIRKNLGLVKLMETRLALDKLDQ